MKIKLGTITFRVVVATLLSAAVSLHAATLTVTSSSDNGSGTLRDALAASGDGDTITFSLPTPATITLTNGELVVNSSVNIVGPGPENLAVKGNNPITYDRIFHVTAGKTVTISSLTITNGSKQFVAPVVGGGIWNDHGFLTVSNCIITGNSANYGGGIYNDGNFAFGQNSATLLVVDCVLTNNYAFAGGGGLHNEGSGQGGPNIGGQATMVISNSSISGNTSGGFGGGIGNRSQNGWLGTKATVQVNNCMIMDNSSPIGGTGGGVGNSALGGGLATFQIFDSTIVHNSARFNGGGFDNQASYCACVETQNINGQDVCVLRMCSAASLVVSNCTVSKNVAGGSQYAYGGGINNAGPGGGDPTDASEASVLVVNSSVISNDCAVGGGAGLFNDKGTLTIRDSSVSGNATGGVAGGVENKNGTLTVLNSTLANNLSTGGGGAIHNTSVSANYRLATVAITNCTLSGNTTLPLSHCGCGDFGGAIYNDAQFMWISHSTLSGNSAASGGGDIRNNGGGSLEISHTLFSSTNSTGSIANFAGTVTSLGYNLSSDSGGGVLTGAGDVTNTNPLLGPLANNGGPTLTHALLPGSPAINAGAPGFSSPPSYDQRGPGFSRVMIGRLDIGAFESQTLPVTLSSPTFHPVTGVQFSLTGLTGVNYVIQASTNLGDGNWISLATNVAPFSFTDTNASHFGQRFYRAAYLP